MPSPRSLLSGLALATAALGVGLAHGAAAPPPAARPAGAAPAAAGSCCAPPPGASDGRSPAATGATSVAVAATSLRVGPTPAPAADAPAPAPLSLTASDGTGLRLVALAANAVLQPPLAFTELRLTFDNPEDRVLEGRFRIAMPEGATISRLAMEIDGRWQEGEVVERQRARAAYEDFLHRRQDPALLEHEAGNEFSARVFPIPARGRKELVVSYSQALPRSAEPYVLPLLGLPEVGTLDVRVLLGERAVAPEAGAHRPSNLGGALSERRVVELHRRDWTPDRDLVVPQDHVARRAGLRHGELALVRVAPPLDPTPQEIAGLYVLVDSSASRALGWAAQVRRVGELAAALRDGAGPRTPLGVAAFDQEVAAVYEGTAGGFGAGSLGRLAARRPLGASDLAGALHWLAGRLADGAVAAPRVLLVTDGIATAGATEARELRAAVRALGDHGVERLDVLAVGGLRDDAALAHLVAGNLRHDGQRLDGDAPLAEIARRLTTTSRSGIAVAVAGASWVWPQTLDAVQPGDEVLVTAELPAGEPLRLSLDGRPVELAGELAAVERPLLARVWAQGRIARLLHLRETAMAGDADLRRALEREATELAVEHRVLTPLTALLVLETEADYARFGLERRGLADILTVGPSGLAVLARSRPPVPAAVADAPKPPPGRNRRGERQPLRSRAAGRADTAAPPEPAPPAAIAEPATALDDLESGELGVAGEPAAWEGGSEAAERDARFDLAAGAAGEEAITVAPAFRRRPAATPPPPPATAPAAEREAGARPWSGRYAEVMAHLLAGQLARGRAEAEAWQAVSPGDVLALLALGEAWERSGETAAAARAYGSLVDLFPSRADMRRLAGQRLERLGAGGLPLTADSYRKAVAQRPDHPSGHRLLAWALLQAGDAEGAFAALEAALVQRYPQGRFAGVDRVLREDLGLAAAAWLRAEPARRGELLARLATHGARLAEGPSLRFVLTWETDANDVDLHVYDARGGHASYQQRQLASGGELFADVTTGYGPECFAIPDPARRAAGPYRLQAHYYSRGPMGYGMGVLHVVAHDGRGGIEVEARPFVVMEDRALLELGEVAVKPGGP